jgi:non-heme chloroperoxidase
MLTVLPTSNLRSVPLATGVTLQYVETGDPAGIPVVFLHGYTDSWRSFEQVLPHLPAGIRALALSQRGHGASDRPHTGYRIPNFAADLAAFLGALKLDDAVIVGHSMGSLVAQRFALDYPGQCRGLVLIGSSTMWHSNPGVLELSAIVADMDDPIDPAFVYEFQASTVARPVPDAIIATAVAESLLVPARVWRQAMTSHLEADYTDELGGITAPTLLLAGGQDELTPYEAQLVLQQGIPGARLVIYPESGHAVHWEDPAQIAADIAAFARDLT